MRILYLGSFRHSWNTEVHLANTLEMMGHSVIRVDRYMVSAWRSCDMALFSTGYRVESSSYAELIKAFRPHMPTVFHSLDLYVGLRCRNLTHPLFKCDYVFTADGGSQEAFAQAGVNHYWLPPGVYEPECYLAEPDPLINKQVIFVGSLRYHPEWPYRQQLVQWLQSTYRDRFKLYGHKPPVRGHKLNQLYAGCQAAIGDTLCHGYRHPNYWSDRVTETLGRGGYLIHPAVPGMNQYFTGGEHLDYYRYHDFLGLQRLIDRALDDPAYRELVRLAGHEHVKRHHTYRQRLEEMLRIVAQGVTNPPEPPLTAELGV